MRSEEQEQEHRSGSRSRSLGKSLKSPSQTRKTGDWPDSRKLAVCLVSLFVSVCRSCVSSSSVPRPPIPRWCPV